MTDDVAIVRSDSLRQPSADVRWMPWQVTVVGYRSGVKGEGAGERRFCAELELMGVTAEVLGGNSPYDLDTSIGSFEVKAPDTSGRIMTSMAGQKQLSTLIAGSSQVMRMFEPALSTADPDFTEAFRDVQDRLSRGNFTHSTLQMVLSVIELMAEASGPWSVVRADRAAEPGPHDWIADPATFISDSVVFPSRCIAADHITLVCEEGYALLTPFEADTLLTFQGDAWGGRPKFHCEQATKKNRRRAIKNSTVNTRDRIEALQRLKRDLRRKEKGHGHT